MVIALRRISRWKRSDSFMKYPVKDGDILHVCFNL